jgi:hypothetical protein
VGGRVEGLTKEGRTEINKGKVKEETKRRPRNQRRKEGGLKG